jgi:UPF0755 protein
MRRPGSRGAFISVFLLFALIFGGAYYGYTIGSGIFQPANPASNTPIAIHILPNETVEQIATDLQAKGLIRNALAFRIWVRIKGLDTKIQAGSYTKLTPSMPVDKIVDGLLNAQPDATYVIIPEGYRLEQIAQKFSAAGLPQFKSADFLKYTKNVNQFPDKAKYPVLKNLPGGVNTMEGLLFPAGYDIPRDADASTVIGIMLTEMQKIVQDNKLMTVANQHKIDSVYTLLKFASIVEREARANDERGNIASVYWNRFYKQNAETAGFLDADPTVQYGRDTQTPPKTTYWQPLADGGKNVAPDSPYNSYNTAGLPPTPICSPGLNSLLAAAAPPSTDYYYFFARKSDNKAVFAPTLQKFMDLEAQEGVSGQ